MERNDCRIRESDLTNHTANSGLSRAPLARKPLGIAVTIICSVIALLLLGCNIAIVYAIPILRLQSPPDFVHHVFGAALDAEETISQLTSWEQALLRLDGHKPGGALIDAIKAYQECIAYSVWIGEEVPEIGMRDPQPAVPVVSSGEQNELRKSLVIMLAEAGRTADAGTVLAKLEASADGEEFATFARYAYRLETDSPPVQCIIPEVSPDWAFDKLTMRLAERSQDDVSGSIARERIERRGLDINVRGVLATEIVLAMAAIGISIPILWILVGRPSASVADDVLVAPWSLGRASGSIMRGLTIGLIVGSQITLISDETSRWGIGSLMLLGPAVLLGRAHLLKPWRLGLSNLIRFPRTSSRWVVLMAMVLFVVGIDWGGVLGISILLERLGIEMHWTEVALEELLCGEGIHLVMIGIEIIVIAPVLEEIVFRGFLYPAFRRRFNWPAAASLTGLLFAAIHGYSLPGFVSVAWGGFVFAVSYEKTKSLLPAMLAHSIFNGLVFFSTIYVFRQI